jgi:hypothetical protein
MTHSLDLEVGRLRHTVRAAGYRLGELDPNRASLLPDALPILAIQRMIARDGTSLTSSVLCRRDEAVRTGPAPAPERAIDLAGLNS